MTRVVLIGTFDTKGEELAFLCDLLVESGVQPFLIDVGVNDVAGITPDVSNREVAQASDADLDELRSAGDRGKAVDAMMRGCARKVVELHAANPIDGVLSIGGSAGTTIATAAMRALPAGVPKVMVSTLASGDVQPYVGTKDVAMMYSITDFTGLNRLSRRILANAAHAVAGMANGTVPEAASDRPMIAATMFGVTTPCVDRVRALLDEEGYELVVFHATGSGGRSMEGLIADGFFEGVVDITTTELADELVGGVLTAGPDRMEIAGLLGLPQVITLGALDMVNFGPKDTIPDKFAGRQFYEHNPTVTLMRTTAEECAQLGELVARKAGHAKGPVTILIPLRGVSAIDAESQVFYDADADRALFDAIRENAASNVNVVDVDAHINDEAFAKAIVDAFINVRS